MHLIVAGLSHKTAPVEIREKLTFPEDSLSEALHALIGYPHLNESVIISTCNRTEVYVVANEPEMGKEDVIHFLCDYHGLCRDELVNYLYFHDGQSVAHHLFRVSASLDSMVVGEAQILGQVKDAYNAAFDAESTSTVLNRLFRHALSTGKKVRAETEIGESAVSVSYAAVELAERVFETLEGRTVLVIGAGEMSELTAKHLVGHGVGSVLVTNRTFKRAEELAIRFSGKAVRYENFLDYMAVADIVISSTGARSCIVSKDNVTQVMHRRRNRPIFLIDIAVPRDIEPAAGDLYNVFLYDIDDLQSVVQANVAERRKAAEVCEAIVDREVSEFTGWLAALDVVPTIASLKEKAEEIRLQEMEKALRRLGELSEADRNTINALTWAIVNKLLHRPFVKIKEAAGRKDGYLYVESLRHLFGLEDHVNPSDKPDKIGRGSVGE